MGCDGGSIPRRDEMVKLKKKAEKVRTASSPPSIYLPDVALVFFFSG